MSFYRGFVLTNNKICIDKFKRGAKLRTFEEVENLPEYAGIIANDSILVDVDDMESATTLLNIVKDKGIKCRVLQSRKGMHFLFKNEVLTDCRTNTPLACGIHADIKCGKKPCYEVLKIDGKEREVLYDTQEYDIIPKIFHPVKTKIEFLNMENGDGRNQSLFNYILTLQSAGFSVDECRDVIRTINKYVLKEPLGENELETVLRDEAFNAPVFFNNKNKFKHNDFGKYLISQYYIKRLNGTIQLYKDGIYIIANEVIGRLMLDHIPTLNRNNRNEVFSFITDFIVDNVQVSSANLIAFENGVYDLVQNKLLEFSPEYVITNKIPWEYNENAKSEAVDTVLNNISCGNADIKNLLLEMAGYSFYRRNELGKAFILTGSGKNGKSTYLKMIRTMLGENNVSSLDIKKLDDKFSTVMLVNKLANIGDDISYNFLSDASTFKKICTGETITCEQKGEKKFQFEPYVKLMFSANEIPRMGKGNDSTAILRRLIIIPFNATFDKARADFDSYIIDKLTDREAIEYLIKLSVEALKRVLSKQEFTEPQSVKAELEEYAKTNNPVLMFFDETPSELIVNHATKEVYLRYQQWCFENGVQATSQKTLSKQIKKHYDVENVNKRINGKVFKVFVTNVVDNTKSVTKE